MATAIMKQKGVPEMDDVEEIISKISEESPYKRRPTQKRTWMTVPEMGKLLGLKKTDRYWLVHKNVFESKEIAGKIRINIASFEKWYANQIKYHKVTGEEPGKELKSWSYSVKEVADLLGVDDYLVYELLKKNQMESLGYEEPDDLRITLATIMMDVINEEEISLEDGILHHQENVDLLPANIELSALEVTMGNVMSREMIMKEYIDAIRCRYDYILIDCMPSLGMMTINALVSSDSVLIPVQAAYLPVKGLQQLIKTILTVKKRLNRKLAIEGILLTMVDFRTNYARDIASRVHTTYGSQIEVFENVIPMSVKAAETSAEGKSIYMHCPKGKVAEAYMKLTQEVLNNEK